MKNLAGVKDAEQVMREEMEKAAIIALPMKNADYEVRANVCGVLGPFTFNRAWYYWKVRGDVPLHIAQELYASETGKRDVRVVGHCGCPPPEKWTTNGVIASYHIDSQEGLNLFVATVKKYGLHK